MKTLRQDLRNRRRAISSHDREKFSRKIAHQVKKLANFKNGHKIALYLPNDGEIDPKYINKFLKKAKISLYLPILSGKSLKFAKVGKNFRKNRFGIQEPVFTQILQAKKLNTIFMPLVGFDTSKNRIGMGGGFYDQTLNFKKRQKNLRSPKLYGLAFDCQKVDQLSAQPWDIPLDAIITPTRIYR